MSVYVRLLYNYRTPWLDTAKARKQAHCGHTMRKYGSCLEKEMIMQGTMPGARRRGRPRTAWIDNIKTWTGLPAEESLNLTKYRDKWRKYIHGVVKQKSMRADWRKQQVLSNRCYKTSSTKKLEADLAWTLSSDFVTDRRRGTTAAAAARQTASISEMLISIQTTITFHSSDAVMTWTLACS